MPRAAKTTFTLIMVQRDSVMKETVYTVFCQSDRDDHIDRIVSAMRGEYVTDWQIVTKQGRRTVHGPILRSHKVTSCPNCLRQYTYNELMEAKEAGQYGQEMAGDLACECGCSFLVDWNFTSTGRETIFTWPAEAAERLAERRAEVARAICSRE